MAATAEKAAEERSRLPTIAAGGEIRAIVPQDFDSAWRIANAVVKAGMAPRGLDTAEKCTIAILHGLEVGLTPMAALQSIAVIGGRPAIWGDGALGLVQGSGKMEWYREHFEGHEGKDDYTAICEVKRRGDPEVKTGRFSVADAKRARLWGKDGPWTTYYPRMLKMRARAFSLRDGFSDVLRGLGIAEEVQDIPREMKDVTPAPSGRDAGPPPPPPPPVERDVLDLAAPARDQKPEEWTDPETGEITELPPVPLKGAAPLPVEAAASGLTEDEQSWLRDLDGALSGCEDDLTCLAEEQIRVMAPMRTVVSAPAWTAAEAVVQRHLKRVQGAAG